MTACNQKAGTNKIYTTDEVVDASLAVFIHSRAEQRQDIAGVAEKSANTKRFCDEQNVPM